MIERAMQPHKYICNKFMLTIKAAPISSDLRVDGSFLFFCEYAQHNCQRKPNDYIEDMVHQKILCR